MTAAGTLRWLAMLALLPAAQIVAQSPPALPDGEGRELVTRVCSQCHSLDTITRAHLSRRQWEARLDEMIGKGARLSDADFELVAQYLTTNFGPAAAQ